MPKLQKPVKQQDGYLTRWRGATLESTPTEPQSMDNNVTALKKSTSSSSHYAHQGDTSTPPLTPESAVLAQSSRSNQLTGSLPTPPRSPNGVNAPRKNSSPGHRTHIHSPKPQSYSRPGFVLATNSSRPASASSHRGMPTYRGPEVTRSGSISMLHHSPMTHRIVDNPLSQFSRPRRSCTNSSPTQQEGRQSYPTDQTDVDSVQDRSVPTMQSPSSRPGPPPIMSHPPAHVVEVAQGETGFGKVATDPIKQSNSAGDTVQNAAGDGKLPATSRSRFSWSWRRGLSRKRVDVVQNDETRLNQPETIPESKSRTGSGTDGVYSKRESAVINEQTTGSSRFQHSREIQEVGHTSHRTIDETEIFDPNRVVPSANIEYAQPMDVKGKGKETVEYEGLDHNTHHDLLADDSIPMYSRCSCCGKLKKPDGDRSLSPVFENENLRTNFSLEIERKDKLATSRREPASAGRPKYTPIIPMIIAEGNIVQAKIAPTPSEIVAPAVDPTPVVDESQPLVNEAGDIIASNGGPFIMLPKALDEQEQGVVRFTSLHAQNLLSRNWLPNDSRGSSGSKVAGSGMRHDVPSTATRDSIPSGMHRIVDQQVDEPTQSDRLASAGDNNTGQAPTSESHITNQTATLNSTDIPQARNRHGVSQYTKPDDSSSSQQIDRLQGPTHEESEGQLGTAVTTDETVPRSSLRKNADLSNAGPRAVSFDPSTVERADDDSPAGSIYRRSMSRHKSESRQNGSSSGVVNYSTKRFTTKPKATAQYLHSANDRNSIYLNPGSASGSRRSSMHSVSSMASTSNRSESELAGRAQIPGSQRHSYAERSSREFEPLPSPQLGKHFGGSSVTLRPYVYTQQRKKQSRLVESVLAATSGGRDKGNFMNDPRR